MPGILHLRREEFSEEGDRKKSMKDEINCGVEDAGIR
jgi:hypothetical protein